ncbi:MAG: HAMP domain-containing sensor histidine kinase [Pseudomonadota bacterium]
MRRNSILRSSVFRIAVGSALLSLSVLLALGWGAYAYYRNQLLNQERDLIAYEAEAAEARFARGGIERLIDDIAIEEEEIWEPDWLYQTLEEGEFVLRLIAGEEETLAGYPDLYADYDWDYAELEHEELDEHPVLVERVWLDDEHSLLVARFMPDELFGWYEFLVFASVVLAFSILPLAVVTGYLLSHSVYRRLSTLADTAAAVGDGTLETRAPLRGNGDEFDRLSEAFNEMLERITLLTRNMRSVSVGVAHDLKTPVSNIDGRLQLIERDLHDPEAVTEHLQRSRSHIAALQRTLDALLRLGEIEAGARRAAFTLVDLSSLSTDLVESFAPVLADLDKSLEGEIASGIFVFGDPDLLTQLVINLLENVGEHARDGAKAWLQLQRSGDDILLVVGDDGPGIPERLRDVLFERFVQLDSARQSSGNGLGLSIVRAIAELHQGSVSLRDGTRGAVFEVRLPSSRSPYSSV